MNSVHFCFWLQGYLELSQAGDPGRMPPLTFEQVQCIRAHLALVFKHEIDPSFGGPEKQAELNAIHDAPKPAPQIGGHAPGRPDLVYRC